MLHLITGTLQVKYNINTRYFISLYYYVLCLVLMKIAKKYAEKFHRRVSGQRHIGEVHKNPFEWCFGIYTINDLSRNNHLSSISSYDLVHA